MQHLSVKRPEILTEIKSIPLFSELDDMQLESIIDQSKIVDLHAGDTLFYAGENASYFYYVKYGQIRLFLESFDGNVKVIDIINSDQVFAEAITFSRSHTYPLNAQALKDSHLYAISIEAFKTILKQSVDTCFRVMGRMAQRLHFQLIEINNLSLHNATYRLIFHLLHEISKHPDSKSRIALDYPKNVLASRLSIKPETLSRILLRLKKKRVIEVKGNQIILSDVGGLKRYLSDDELFGT